MSQALRSRRLRAPVDLESLRTDAWSHDPSRAASPFTLGAAPKAKSILSQSKGSA